MDGEASLMARDKDFEQGLKAAKVALQMGDARPAEVLLSSVVGETRRLALAGLEDFAAAYESEHGHRPWPEGMGMTEGQRGRLNDSQKRLRRIQRLFAGAPRDIGALPTPANDPPQAYARIKKARVDPARSMKLSIRQQWAAAEIRSVFYETTRGLHAKGNQYSERVDKSVSANDPFNYMRPGIADARRRRYLPWIEAHQDIVASHKDGALTEAGLVMAVLIDEWPIRAIARAFDTDPRKLRAAFGRALDGYGGPHG